MNMRTRAWGVRKAALMYRIMQATKLVELLDEAKNLCKAELTERRGEETAEKLKAMNLSEEEIEERRKKRGEPFTEAELEEFSAIMGYGAVKYADLKNNRKTDYKHAPVPRLPQAVCIPVCGTHAYSVCHCHSDIAMCKWHRLMGSHIRMLHPCKSVGPKRHAESLCTQSTPSCTLLTLLLVPETSPITTLLRPLDCSLHHIHRICKDDNSADE